MISESDFDALAQRAEEEIKRLYARAERYPLWDWERPEFASRVYRQRIIIAECERAKILAKDKSEIAKRAVESAHQRVKRLLWEADR